MTSHSDGHLGKLLLRLNSFVMAYRSLRDLILGGILTDSPGGNRRTTSPSEAAGGSMMSGVVVIEDEEFFREAAAAVDPREADATAAAAWLFCGDCGSDPGCDGGGEGLGVGFGGSGGRSCQI